MAYQHNLSSPPVVELQIRAMGEIITSQVALMAAEISDRVAHAVEQTVVNFDFESYVRSETEIFLREYMTEGAGGDAVRDIAQGLGQAALSKMFKTE